MSAYLQKKIQFQWDKHAHSRGGHEMMWRDEFERSVIELVPDWHVFPALKPDRFALHYCVLQNSRSGTRGVRQLFWNGIVWVHPGGPPLEQGCKVTHWMPINEPELP